MRTLAGYDVVNQGTAYLRDGKAILIKDGPREPPQIEMTPIEVTETRILNGVEVVVKSPWTHECHLDDEQWAQLVKFSEENPIT